MILLLDMSDIDEHDMDDDTQAQYLEDVAELMRYKQQVRREQILERKRERLDHLRRLRGIGTMGAPGAGAPLYFLLKILVRCDILMPIICNPICCSPPS